MAAPYELIVVGASLGGTQALGELLRALPPTLPAVVAIVLHRGEGRNDPVEVLSRLGGRDMIEPVDKESLLPGRIYLAPADYHLLVESGQFALSIDAPVLFARPSINVLFESAADTYGRRTIGVILTGANRDGVQGMLDIKRAGGLTVVQDPATAECCELPDAVLAAMTPDRVLKLADIGPFLAEACSR